MSCNLYHTISDQKSVKTRKAFTLIELLIVIAIIATLAAILFPVFAQAKEAAKKTTCLSNLKEFAIAFQLYVQDYDDNIPRTSSQNPAPNVSVYQDYLYSQKYDANTSPATVTYSGGLLDAYLKAFALTGCPAGKEQLTVVNVAEEKLRGLLSVQYGVELMNSAGVNFSEIQEPVNTIMVGDTVVYRQVVEGFPVAGIYSQNYLRNSSTSSYGPHGRHNGQACTAWLDGHAKAIRLQDRDAEPDASFTSIGTTNAVLKANHIGWICPPGLVASGTPASVRNDPKFNNYFTLKKK